MKLFECQNCGQLLYFENTQCERCGMTLGFVPDLAQISALEQIDDGSFAPLADRGRKVVFCANHANNACNWLVEQGGDALCGACGLNHTIPDLTQGDNLRLWQRIEVAKHRLVYGLMRLGLPLESKTADPEHGLRFDFLAPAPGEDGQGKIMTGHDHGDITLNVAEADDAIRAEIREKLHEPFRTLLGHFRHEIAHYYFERVVVTSPSVDEFRRVFGDEREDYGEALKRHYANGAPADWQLHHISAYASSHPHEDWAETFAHYLHMVDTLETAYAFGLRIRPRAGQDDNLRASISFDPYVQTSFDPIIEAWLPVTFAVNSINRSMGIDDLYPFVVNAAVIEKLKTVHNIIHVNSENQPTLAERLRRMVGSVI